jgi:hypothetical protein
MIFAQGISGAESRVFRRKLCGGLANHDEVVENCIACLPVESTARDVVADSLNGVENVSKT